MDKNNSFSNIFIKFFIILLIEDFWNIFKEFEYKINKFKKIFNQEIFTFFNQKLFKLRNKFYI